MKLFKNLNIKEQFSTNNSKHGSFAAGLIAIAIIIVIVFNLLVSQLPDGLSSLDVSGRDLYTVSDTSVKLLQSLNQDVKIIVLAENKSLDKRIEKFVNKYASLSDKISVEYIDPVQHPSALQTYNADENSIVVSCPATDKQQVIAFTDIIQYDTSSYYSTGQYTETAFDAEGQLTSALDYVTSNTTKTAYTLSGHQETELSATVTDQMDKSHFSVKSLNLLTTGSIPADCDLIICNAPTADLANDELTMLKNYLAKGGHMTLILSSKDADIPNFKALMKLYGITEAEGYAVDYSRYYQNTPTIFFPVLSTDSSITADFGDDALTLVYNSRALSTTTPARTTIKTDAFMTTSDNAAVATDSTQTKGQYDIAVASTEKISDDKTAVFTVYGADSIIADDIISAFSNVVNMDVFMNSLTNGFSDVSNISIEPKSLQTSYNTISHGGIWSGLIVIVIPLAVLIFGLVRWMRRRKL